MSAITSPQAHAQTPATPAAIEVAGVSFRYDERKALDDLSLDVPAGSVCGLLGPNGSGKSTLLSLFIGRRTAQSGSIRIFGEALTPALRGRIGVVFQEPSVDPVMTVIETMLLQARLFGMPRATARAETARLLDRLGLADRAADRTATLSGGLRRRLELARALLTSPDLILLDEPTLALDPDARQAIWGYLRDANAAGATLLVATNDVYEAERNCHTVALIDEGRMVAQGAPSELKRGLRHDAVRIDWRCAPPDGVVAGMRGWAGVGGLREAGMTTHVTVDRAAPFLARAFEEAGPAISGVRIEESTLEDVYFQLVGKAFARRTPERTP